nr:hypothetical protein CFP56_28370 [Quercus suber]
MVAEISPVKIRFIGRKQLRSQDKDRGRKHYLQSRSDSLVTGIYVAKIKIMVADISSVKIRSIGHDSQDQDRGRRHFFSQDQIHWSQAST